MKDRLGIIVAIYAALLSTFCVGWIVWTQSGRKEFACEKATIQALTVRELAVKDGGKDLMFLGKSRVTGGGGFALMNKDGAECVLASDGALALLGTDADAETKALLGLHGWSLILGATRDGATVAMKGDKDYEVVLESGKTSDDPLAIRGGRINLSSAGQSAKVDSSGVQEAPRRNW
jgi:hypothetical protein